MMSKSNGLSQQTVRAFGVHINAFVDDPVITAHDFAGLASLKHRPSPFQEPYLSLYTLLIVDFVASVVQSAPTEATSGVTTWSAPGSGSTVKVRIDEHPVCHV